MVALSTSDMQREAGTAKRCVIYCRVSTNTQEEDGSSLVTQGDRCRAYAAERGYVIVAVYAEVWSGYQYRERPQLAALREVVRQGGADVVIAYAADRISRNQTHMGVLLDEWTTARAALELVSEDFENSAVGKFLLSARTFAAELEREKILERTMRGRLQRAREGKLLPSHHALYGYTWVEQPTNRGKLSKVAYQIDPTTGPIVRRIFAEFAAGRSLRQISAALIRDGIPTPAGGSVWLAVSVRNMIRNPSYTGRAIANRWRAVRAEQNASWMVERPADEQIMLPDGVIPPLVDVDTWQAAQEVLTRNKRWAATHVKHPESHLLRGGHVICDGCGQPMHVRHTEYRSGEAKPTYDCGTKKMRRGFCPAPTTVRAAILDADVWQMVRAALENPILILNQVDKRAAEEAAQPDTLAAEVAALERSLAKVTAAQSKLVKRLAAEDDDDVAALIQQELKAITKQRRDLEGERGALQGQIDEREAAKADMAAFRDWLTNVARNLDAMDYAMKRVALEALGVTVRVRKAEPGHAGQRRWSVKAVISLDEAGVPLSISSSP